MTKPKRNFFTGLIVGLWLTTIVVVPVVVQAQADPIKLQLNVPIPGFTALCENESGELLVNENTFGCYVRNFYIWFTGVAGILAVVMIMWAGIQWITAAGNETRISSAKSTMNGASIGLIILLTSYLLLTWINPALVSLRIPALSSVDTKLLSRYCHELSPDYLKATQEIHGELACGDTYTVYLGANETNNSCLGTYCAGTASPDDTICAPTDRTFKNFDCLDPKTACLALNDYLVPSARSQADCDIAQDRSLYNTSGVLKHKCVFIKNKCEYKAIIQGCEQLQNRQNSAVADWVSCNECINNPSNESGGVIYKPQECIPKNNNHLGDNGGNCKEPGDYTGLLEIDGVCCKFTKDAEGLTTHKQGDHACFQPNDSGIVYFLSQ